MDKAIFKQRVDSLQPFTRTSQSLYKSLFMVISLYVSHTIGAILQLLRHITF